MNKSMTILTIGNTLTYCSNNVHIFHETNHVRVNNGIEKVVWGEAYISIEPCAGNPAAVVSQGHCPVAARAGGRAESLVLESKV